MGGARRCSFWRNDTGYACAFNLSLLAIINRLGFVVEVSDTHTAAHNSDEDDMENGSLRADGYARVPGSAVGSFYTLMFIGD